MKWFVVRQEGGEREYMSFADLRKVAETVPIVGAESEVRAPKARVVHDKILQCAGRPPFCIEWADGGCHHFQLHALMAD